MNLLYMLLFHVEKMTICHLSSQFVKPPQSVIPNSSPHKFIINAISRSGFTSNTTIACLSYLASSSSIAVASVTVAVHLYTPSFHLRNSGGNNIGNKCMPFLNGTKCQNTRNHQYKPGRVTILVI